MKKQYLVYNYIRAFRIDLGMTQQQLADIVGVSKNMISDYELQKSQPSLLVAHCISEALGVKFSYVFRFSEVFPKRDDLLGDFRRFRSIAQAFPNYHHPDE